MLFGKKKIKTKCCCEGSCGAEESKTEGKSKAVVGEKIIILGSVCAKCNQLEANTKEALTLLGISDEIEHVTDFAQIASCGVMFTPALMMGEKVISSGRVLKAEEIIELLKKQ
ncbi:MAG: thioredoxin family protein [Oscillospiraceae bacterium]|nr:thioredoxin family protein [Oscillospiraceae bacterium]